MALRLLAAAAFVVAVIFSTPVDAAPQNALDRSPSEGRSYVTTASCLSPSVHDDMIEAVLMGEPELAGELWRQAFIMGACERHPDGTYAQFDNLLYRFSWPDAPGYYGEQWEITLPSGSTRYILIVVRGANG